MHLRLDGHVHTGIHVVELVGYPLVDTVPRPAEAAGGMRWPIFNRLMPSDMRRVGLLITLVFVSVSMRFSNPPGSDVGWCWRLWAGDINETSAPTTLFASGQRLGHRSRRCCRRQW